MAKRSIRRYVRRRVLVTLNCFASFHRTGYHPALTRLLVSSELAAVRLGPALCCHAGPSCNYFSSASHSKALETTMFLLRWTPSRYSGRHSGLWISEALRFLEAFVTLVSVYFISSTPVRTGMPRDSARRTCSSRRKKFRSYTRDSLVLSATKRSLVGIGAPSRYCFPGLDGSPIGGQEPGPSAPVRCQETAGKGCLGFPVSNAAQYRHGYFARDLRSHETQTQNRDLGQYFLERFRRFLGVPMHSLPTSLRPWPLRLRFGLRNIKVL